MRLELTSFAACYKQEGYAYTEDMTWPSADANYNFKWRQCLLWVIEKKYDSYFQAVM